MYSRQETSQIRKKFWTHFGQYMRPIPGASGDTMNWLNYKTGKKHIYIRMDAGRHSAAIRLELRHPDPELRLLYFDQLLRYQSLLQEYTGESWQWIAEELNEDGQAISSAGIALPGPNVMKEEDWPQIISFLKPRLIALDQFWDTVKELID